MKKIAVLAVAALALAGCLEPVSQKVADGINRYCAQPVSERRFVREQVNAELARYGHSIVVTCSGDPQ